MLEPVDYIVLLGYLVGVAALGIKAGGRQYSTSDYFLGSRNMPWWAVCFSVVATETSTLTVIGIPAVSYLGTLTFLQITLGYVLGRILVSLWFLPRYYAGRLSTAYEFLGRRFGDSMRGAASVTFMLTRLLADGVRLFATAIPIKVIAETVGIGITYPQIIVGIGLVTMAYTYIGGIKAVVWMDVVQMVIYVGGAILAVVLLLGQMPPAWWATVSEAGKTQFINFGSEYSFSEWLTQPYTFITATIGGAIFSMASHGTDQLIVQRLLTCKNKSDSRKALIVSGFVVMFQFALFLLVGLLLWIYYNQQGLAELGLSRGDEIFPKFIIEGMPPGVSGLVLAGILAAAMSTLSSSLNALASSTMMDLYERIFPPREINEARALRISRLFTLFWGVVFMVFASVFEDNKNPVVELGLAIASFTYGGLLGVFLLGLINKHANQRDALIAFFVTLVVMIWVIFGIWYSTVDGQWVFTFYPSVEVKAELGLRGLGWPWYTALGAAILIGVGSLLARMDDREDRNQRWDPGYIPDE